MSGMIHEIPNSKLKWCSSVRTVLIILPVLCKVLDIEYKSTRFFFARLLILHTVSNFLENGTWASLPGSYHSISTNINRQKECSKYQPRGCQTGRRRKDIISYHVGRVVSRKRIALPCRAVPSTRACIMLKTKSKRTKPLKTHQMLCVKAVPTANGNRFQSKISGPPWPATASSARRMR
jgi:hypothetical protein